MGELLRIFIVISIFETVSLYLIPSVMLNICFISFMVIYRKYIVNRIGHKSDKGYFTSQITAFACVPNEYMLFKASPIKKHKAECLMILTWRYAYRSTTTKAIASYSQTEQDIRPRTLRRTSESASALINARINYDYPCSYSYEFF